MGVGRPGYSRGKAANSTRNRAFVADREAAGMTAAGQYPPVPAYLLKGADGESPAPPIQPREAELPLGQLSWPNFERLCYRLAQRIADVEHVQIYGTPGQDQEGIDIYARFEDDYCVFQCRRTKTMPSSRIKAAVDDFANSDWGATATTFVLCTADSLRSTPRAAEVERQAARLRANEQAFVPWDLEHLSDELRDKGDLVDEFFGPVWRERFCVHVLGPVPTRVSNNSSTRSPLSRSSSERCSRSQGTKACSFAR